MIPVKFMAGQLNSSTTNLILATVELDVYSAD